MAEYFEADSATASLPSEIVSGPHFTSVKVKGNTSGTLHLCETEASAVS